MPDFNATNVINGLQKVLDAVEQLTPVAAAIGGPTVANVAILVNTGAAIANNVLERVEEGVIVAESRDTHLIQAMILDLQAQNDKLNELVSKS